MSVEGRWTGSEYIWTCPGCRCVRCSNQVPSTDEARCLRCRTTDAATSIQQLVDKLQGERDEFLARATRAERQNGAYEDEIFDLKKQLAELQEKAA